MILIIGLGNPDPEYAETRHNIGFMILDFLAKKAGADGFEKNKKLNALVTKGSLANQKIFLAKPLLYVNKSGEAAAKLVKNLKLKINNLVVIQDDLDIEFGNVKLSFDKNSGGHKGVESIIKALKTKKFYRIRIGTSTRSLQKARQQSDKKRNEFVRDFVLSKFSPKERETLKDIQKQVLQRLEQIL